MKDYEKILGKRSRVDIVKNVQLKKKWIIK